MSQILMQLGMLSSVGSLFNELLIILKEVTPSLWRKEFFIVFYFLNSLFIPGKQPACNRMNFDGKKD